MAQDYTQIVDRLRDVLTAERTDALSDDLSTPVTAVKIGQYVPSATSDKPIVYVRLISVATVADMAGNMSRLGRINCLISGAVAITKIAQEADHQEESHNDGCNLMNNIENILMHYGTDTLWSGGHLGLGQSSDDDNPERYGELTPEPGGELSGYHF
ncbi:MAG: hypothetical protein Q7N50_00225, partial [Armatimonadota bacterium]|nr:hypothetical protein [Armatimonadota bacterium]